MISLTSVSGVLKSRRFLIILIMAAVGLIVVAFFMYKSFTQPRANPWRGVVPGKTTKDQLSDLLGTAIDQKQEGSQLVYQYPSENRFRPHDVIVEQGKVVLVKEEVLGKEKGVLADFIKKLGGADGVFYGTHGTAAPLYLFSRAGLAIYANSHDGQIIEIWYFQPTTAQNFLNKFGQGFLNTIPRRF